MEVTDSLPRMTPITMHRDNRRQKWLLLPISLKNLCSFYVCILLMQSHVLSQTVRTITSISRSTEAVIPGKCVIKYWNFMRGHDLN